MISPPLRKVAALDGIILFVALILGSAFPHGFAGNLIAEIAGVALSIFIAVFVVERLLEKQRQ